MFSVIQSKSQQDWFRYTYKIAIQHTDIRQSKEDKSPTMKDVKSVY